MCLIIGEKHDKNIVYFPPQAKVDHCGAWKCEHMARDCKIIRETFGRSVMFHFSHFGFREVGTILLTTRWLAFKKPISTKRSNWYFTILILTVHNFSIKSKWGGSSKWKLFLVSTGFSVTAEFAPSADDTKSPDTTTCDTIGNHFE